MKDLFQSFFYALVVGLVAFCFIVLIDRNIGFIKWRNKAQNEKLKKEADDYANNLDKMVEKSLDIYDKVVNDGKEKRKKTTPPPTLTKASEKIETIDTKKEIADNTKEEEEEETPPSFESNFEQEVADTRPTSSNDMTDGYQIQVGVLVKNTDLTAYNSLRDLGKLKTQTINREAKRILLGDFATRGIAEEMLDEVRGLGFSDAFIVSKPPKQATPTIAQNAPVKTTIGTTSVGNNAYIIQLSAMREPRPQLFSHLREYGNIYKEYDASRQLTKIQLGPFNNETAANQTLAQVKQKGLNTVFLKKVTQTDMNRKVKVYSQL